MVTNWRDIFQSKCSLRFLPDVDCSADRLHCLNVALNVTAAKLQVQGQTCRHVSSCIRAPPVKINTIFYICVFKRMKNNCD